MSENTPSTTRRLVERWIDAWNGRDLDVLKEIFHPEFTWHIAVTEPGNPQMRDLQSDLLRGKNLPWEKAIYNKDETIAIFSTIFDTAAEFHIEPHAFIEDGDRIAVELVGNAYTEEGGRQYNNLYCHVFTVRDGQILLFREYQDTLLLFDVWTGLDPSAQAAFED